RTVSVLFNASDGSYYLQVADSGRYLVFLLVFLFCCYPVFGGSGMSLQGFTARQNRCDFSQFRRTLPRTMNDGRAFDIIVNAQGRGKPGGAGSWQHMVWARAVIAQSFGCIAAEKHRTGMTYFCQPGFGGVYR